MLKKSVSWLLSFAIFITAISATLGIDVKTVEAATGISSFEGDLNKSLTEGTNNGVPAYVSGTGADNSAFMSFSLGSSPDNQDILPNEYYTLSYPISNGIIMEMKVKKVNDTNVTVIYAFKNATTGAYIDNTASGADTFYIYSYKNGYQKQNSFSPNGEVVSGNYVVTDSISNTADSDDSVANTDKAVFHIVRGSGFSFKYGGINAHFRWDDNSNTFQFFSSGFYPGNIYTANLTYSDAADNVLATDNRDIFLGLSLDNGKYLGDGLINNGTYIAAPFANWDGSASGKKYYEKDLLNNPEIPGAQTNGITFGFTIPKVWDDTTKSFVLMPSSSSYDAGFTISIAGRTLEVSDLKLNSVPTVKAYGSGDQFKIGDITTVDANGQFYFDLVNLPIGTIFENVKVTPGITGPNQVVQPRSDALPFGEVFTFPEFSVIQMNSKFYVRLKPFKTNNSGTVLDIDGAYLLKTSNSQSPGIGYYPSVTQWTDGTDEFIYFPLTLSADNSAGSQYKYQLFFNPKNKSFENVNNVGFNDYVHTEQYLYTVPGDSGNLKAPENFTVNDYTLSAIPGIDKKDEMKLSLDVTFDIALEAQLKKMLENSSTNSIDVYYVLTNYLTPDPDDEAQKEFTYVKIHIDGADTANPVATYYLSETEGDFSNPFNTIADVPLEKVFRADVNSNVYVANFLFDVRAQRIGGKPDTTGRPINFDYPNIYFLTVNLDKLDRDCEDGSSQAIEDAFGGSGYESITLNDISDKDVPPPQSISIDNITKKSFDINWEISGTGVKDYISELYTKSELLDIRKNIGFTNGKPNLNAYYNIYIGTNETYMTNTFSSLPLPDDSDSGYTDTRTNKSNVTVATTSASAIDVTTTTGDDGTLLINTLRATNGVVMISQYPIFKEGEYTDVYAALQDIYNNKTNIEDMLSITGLDKNKKYYVYADLVIENRLDATNTYKKSSKLSPLTGGTTLSDIDVPDDDDKVPPSPILKLVKTAVDNVSLSWDPIVIKNSDGTNSLIEYDIIRVRDFQMESKYLTTKESFTYTWDYFLPSKATDVGGYRTDVLGTSVSPYILQYNSSTDKFEATKKAILDPKTIGFQDTGLSPNKVYFYYVRAVRVLSDGTYAYSNWSRISATTSNIENPTNLRINTGYEPYDAKTEMVLNFDAPITDVNKIGVDYDFYYSIKKDGEAWSSPVLMNAATLKAGVTGITNSKTNFNYKVTGLLPGTSYTFKVKMVDKTTNASSLYSNDARGKTDLDQDDYDNDDKTDSWTDYIIKLLTETMNDYYWTVKDTSGVRDIIYREEKFSGFMNSTSDNFITLIPAKNGAVNNYYISAKSYEALSNANKGIKVVYKNTEYYITAKALSDSLTAAKKDVNEGDTEDYYIKISLSGYASSAVNGESTLSDIMTFDIITTGFETTAKAYESETYAKLVASLTTNSDDMNDLIDDIKEYVEDGKTDLEIQQLVYDRLPDLKEELLDIAGDLFDDYLSGSKYNSTITKTNGQIAISLTGASADTIANAYYRSSGNWVLKNVNNNGGKRTFTTNETGQYVFTGKVLYLPGLDGLDYASSVKDLIIKYGLDEYLGSGSTFNTSGKLTGNMIMGSTAKILGMNSLDNPVNFLKNKNIVASERVSRSNITTGDMIYYLMKIYEAKTGTNIDNVNITNYNATNGMTGLTSQNKKAVQVATQIGLVRDAKFNAKYEATVKDFLYYLNRLNEIIKL